MSASGLGGTSRQPCPEPLVIEGQLRRIQGRGAGCGFMQLQRREQLLLQPILPRAAGALLQDGRVDVVAQVVVIEAIGASARKLLQQLRVQRRIRAADIRLQRGDDIGTQGNAVIEQIGQGPGSRIDAVRQVQLRPLIGQGTVQAQHALLVQQLRQQPHIRLGL